MMLGFVQSPAYGGGGGGGYTGCAGDGVGAFTRLFTQADLVDDIVNVHHTFGTENVIVQVYDENNQLVLPSEIIINDGYDVDVSLVDGTPITGTWRVTLISQTGGCNSIGSYARSFTQADLVNDILPVYHNLGSESVIVQVYDNLNQLVLPTEIRAADLYNVEVSLVDGTPIVGTWHLTIVSTSGYLPTPGGIYGIDGAQGATGASAPAAPPSDWVLLDSFSSLSAPETTQRSITWDPSVYSNIKVECSHFSNNSLATVHLYFNDDSNDTNYPSAMLYTTNNTAEGNDSVNDGKPNLADFGILGETLIQGCLTKHGRPRNLRMDSTAHDSSVSEMRVRTRSFDWSNTSDDVVKINIDTSLALYKLWVYAR